MKTTTLSIHNTDHIIQSLNNVENQSRLVLSSPRTTKMSTTTINNKYSPPIVQVPNGKLFRKKPDNNVQSS
jgi:hypothetical protein